MIDLGIVRPGSTIRVPFSSFDKDDGSAVTMTNFAAADILIYKDGGTTERASTAGFTATTDFDGKTGKHLAIIDLADNTTAGFYTAGSEYMVAIDSVTVDGVTTGGWIARFRIGHPAEWYSTTIASLSSQTSFTLTTGPAEDDALNGHWCIIHDIASAVQCGKALILDYTGSTKTVTLAAGTTFTAAAGDNISIMDMAPLQPAAIGRTLVVDAAGLADANAVKLGPSGSGTAQTARDVGASVLLSSGTGTGQISLSSGAVLLQATQTGVTIPTVTNLTNAPTAGDFTATMKTSIGTAVAASAVASVTGNVGGNVAGSVGSVTGLTASDVGAIKAKTDNLPTDPADQSLVIAATDALATLIGDVPTNAELATALAGADDAVLAVLGTPAGVSLAADIAAVKVDTAAILVDTGTTLDGKIDDIKANTDKFANLPVLTAGGTGGQGYGAP